VPELMSSMAREEAILRPQHSSLGVGILFGRILHIYRSICVSEDSVHLNPTPTSSIRTPA
jgi:hypothetical protein